MRVGFIGLGNVGGRLSGSLLRNGVDLAVHDLDSALVESLVFRGARAGGTPLAMMRDCDTVVTCLPSPAASSGVVEEMLPAVGGGKIWMEMSTTDEAGVRRLGEAVAARGGAAARRRTARFPAAATGRRRETSRYSRAATGQPSSASCRF